MYSVGRRTKRWPLCLFFKFLDVVAINSAVIYKAVKQDGGMARKYFIKQLALQLIGDALNMRNQAKYLSRDLQVLVQKHAGTSSLEAVGKGDGFVSVGRRQKWHTCVRTEAFNIFGEWKTQCITSRRVDDLARQFQEILTSERPDRRFSQCWTCTVFIRTFNKIDIHFDENPFDEELNASPVLEDSVSIKK
ncbi:hypothetical protein LAZ67_3001764 [Cordylochernes scorpioides]|uniref:PiggyBac transposable element-derived protein domain-containing protein n=1 Tax=Cordylochernes scorpioides TaxID=51811 RepID=A0ABY6KA53_9ARAC|nr:hypothetical protein LAZ67_3001764 [Cordylochernes scorpioides]